MLEQSGDCRWRVEFASNTAPLFLPVMICHPDLKLDPPQLASGKQVFCSPPEPTMEADRLEPGSPLSNFALDKPRLA